MKTCNIIVSQNPPPNRRVEKQESFQQLELFPIPQKRQKPQISSIPGISVTTRRRYQVTIGDRVVAARLTVDEAWEIAANCTGAKEVDA